MYIDFWLQLKNAVKTEMREKKSFPAKTPAVRAPHIPSRDSYLTGIPKTSHPRQANSVREKEAKVRFIVRGGSSPKWPPWFAPEHLNPGRIPLPRVSRIYPPS